MSDTFSSSEITNPLAYGVLPPSSSAEITVNLEAVITALQPLNLLPSILADLSAISVAAAAAASQLITVNTNLGTIEGTLLGVATEATLLTRASEVTLLTRATEATLSTRSTEATLLTRATEATLLTIATEATLATRASEVTLSTRASEVTLSTRASEATLATRVADATITARLNVLGQNTMAASAPVVIASNQSAVPVSGTVSVTEPVSVDDNGGSLTVDTPQLPAALVGGRLDVVVGDALPAGTNNIGDVDVLTVPAPLSTAGGGTEAAALRVTVATDSTGVLSVDDNGASLTIDTPQLPAALVGGRLDVVVGAALPAGTNNIGDVDVLTVPAPLSTTGGGTEATALRVTVANDSTGVLSVDDNGGSLTIDTTQLPAALVGSRLDINTGAWLGSTAPTVGQKTMANSVPVVIASDQASIPVANTPAQNSGKTVNRFVLSQVATPGTTLIAAADVSNKHKIVGFVLTMSLAGTVKFIDSSGDLTGAMDVSTQGGFVISPNVDFPFIQTGAINRSISIVTTLGGANGVILYITEP